MTQHIIKFVFMSFIFNWKPDTFDRYKSLFTNISKGPNQYVV